MRTPISILFISFVFLLVGCVSNQSAETATTSTNEEVTSTLVASPTTEKASATTHKAATTHLVSSSTAAPTTTMPGEYAPVIDSSNFVSGVTNPYYSLKPGTTHVYLGVEDGEAIHVEDYVTNITRTILGVKTTQVRNRDIIKGKIAEETTDWYAQDKDGNVWYFGEDVKEFQNGVVTSTRGSWEAGVNGAKPGILIEGDPKIGDTFRQEYYKGEAEDMAQVAGIGLNATTKLGNYSNVILVKEWSQFEPGKFFWKYYAKGAGRILEIVNGTGTGRIELTEIKHDA